MGTFCVNFHFKTVDQAALSAALKRRRIRNHRIIPVKNGWTSLLEEEASNQDDQRIRDLAGDLSKDLKSPVIAFLVHDSDVACYWLYEQGRLLDEFNSCPDYFENGATGGGGPSGGDPAVLIRYCRPGVREEQLAAILAQETLFAEGVVEQLADALGIDADRALADYRHDDDFDGGDDDVEGGGRRGGGDADSIRSMIAGHIGQMLGGATQTSTDPQAAALVDAAVRGDDAEIQRLLDMGAPVDAIAPAPFAVNEQMRDLGLAAPGELPKAPMSPLLAAVTHKRIAAVERLLDHGANPNQVNLLFGTTVHAAAGAGDAETLALLIARGGDVHARNAQGMTPLQVLSGAQASQERMAQVQEMMKSMGAQVPGIVERMSQLKLPTKGWAACEQLLRSRGAS